MKPVYNYLPNIFIRLHYPCSLIFFVLACCSSCKQETGAIALVWNNNQATGILVPKHLLDNNIDTINKWMQVRVEKSDSIKMLGDFSIQEENIVFNPVVPLTRGLIYEIYFRNKLVGKIKVPLANAADAARVFTIYPSPDTLPENLLKVYIEFSSPMREGESQKYISLLDEKNDSLPGIFLDLQPELWNEEGTILTVWLDPGRIKRDLIPNRQMGNPLKKGFKYSLFISEKWKDAKGLQLQESYSKEFFVGDRDSLSPDQGQWKLNMPRSKTTDPLEINFGEPLDFFLLQETIRVVDENKNVVPGKIRVVNKETGIQFIPVNKWSAGRYRLEIQSILEDLAGNNLNKLFDRDITVKKINADTNIFERIFEIK